MSPERKLGKNTSFHFNPTLESRISNTLQLNTSPKRQKSILIIHPHSKNGVRHAGLLLAQAIIEGIHIRGLTLSLFASFIPRD